MREQAVSNCPTPLQKTPRYRQSCGQDTDENSSWLLVEGKGPDARIDSSPGQPGVPSLQDKKPVSISACHY